MNWQRILIGAGIGGGVGAAQNVLLWARSDRKRFCAWKVWRRFVAGALSGAFAALGVEI